ncbi:MAG: hypothetical protein WBV82_26655, partial [Myxococcaceae bacterium]
TASAPVNDPELNAVRNAFDVGRYDQALDRAQARIDRGELAHPELELLHRYAGLAAFNLDRRDVAERHFGALLRLSPDYVLDPFEVPPPAIAWFEEIRKKLAPQLELIREQKRIEVARLEREAEERALRQREEEERRRRLDELTRKVTVRTVEKRAFLVNFVPFGTGQFQQQRTGMGITLAATQGVAAITSIIAYFAYEGVLKEQKIPYDSITGSPKEIFVKVVPKDRQDEANTWRVVKYASAGAFLTLYGYGVVDALYHHQDEVVTTSEVQLPPQPERPAQPRRSAPDDPTPVPHGFLFPTDGGLGAGVSLRF